MYNRYIPGTNGHTRVAAEDRLNGGEARPRRSTGQKHEERQGAYRSTKSCPPFLSGEDKNAGIAGILKSLHLEDLDSGDVLLLLIILLVFLEGDNIELVITLALMLLFSLGGEKERQKE